jgi:hypothetical protein
MIDGVMHFDRQEVSQWTPDRQRTGPKVRKLPPGNAHGLDPTVTAKPKRRRKDKE